MEPHVTVKGGLWSHMLLCRVDCGATCYCVEWTVESHVTV